MIRRFEFIVIMLLTVTQIVLVFGEATGPLRVASGFLFMALLPGYSLLAFIYPPARALDPLEHVVAAMPLSLALHALLGLLFNRVSLAVPSEAHVVWMSVVILLLTVGGLFREPGAQQQRSSRTVLLSLVILSALALGFIAEVQADRLSPERVVMGIKRAA